MSLKDGLLQERGFSWVENPRNGGGTFDPENEDYPWRICLHTTEGSSLSGISTHPYPPHLWYDPKTRVGYQTVPLTRSAYALYQSAFAPYYTNRANCLQVEIVGYAAEAADWSDNILRNIASDVILPLTEFVLLQGGTIDWRDEATPLPGPIPNSAKEDAPQRLDPKVWAFGPIWIVSHRHVPMGDDHWDAPFDARRIRDLVVTLLPSITSDPSIAPTRTRVRDMDFTKRPGEAFYWEPLKQPCDAYDFPLVPAGCQISVAKLTPEEPDFPAQVIANAEIVAAANTKWGSPWSIPIKTNSFVSVVVPAGSKCRIVAV